MVSDAVRAYYASFGEREWARLENPADGMGEIAFYMILSVLFLALAVLDFWALRFQENRS